MPFYEFKCEECNIVMERNLPINTRIKFIICHKCGREAKKIISNSTFILKGGGWYTEGYTKEKK